MNDRIHVSEEPARAVAERLVRELRPLEHARIAVSGGSTPKALFRLLADEYRDRIDWTKVSIFQVDERRVPHDDDRSNWKMLHKELISKVRGVRAHRMEVDHPGMETAYEALLRAGNGEMAPGNVPVLDIVLLGMGADGHTASLFPGTAACDETKRLVVVNDDPSLDPARWTMTFPILNAARHKWFLAAGADKAEAFRQAQQGAVPAGRIERPEWFVDSGAAGR